MDEKVNHHDKIKSDKSTSYPILEWDFGQRI
jgi:hypothetical protein